MFRIFKFIKSIPRAFAYFLYTITGLRLLVWLFNKILGKERRKKISTAYKKRQRIWLSLIIGSLLLFLNIIFSANDLNDTSAVAFGLFWLLILYNIIMWLFGIWKQYQSLKSEKSKAELMMLKAQVNPHFFFNTLNNLYGLAKEKSEDAPEMILKLSEMMRYTIYEGKKDLVPLASEINYLKGFIELQKMRYHKAVDIQFNHHIQQNDIQITPLLYIILLENAFKHGVDTQIEAAYVHIQLIAGNSKVLFAIENNFDPNEVPAGTGIGLENLKRRLALIYPDNHQLSIIKELEVFKVQLELEVT
jgi:sensor histidine kinase YesM